VILLVGLEDMSYEEVANVLNVPVGTVRSRLSRGRDQLRRLMGMEERTSRRPRYDGAVDRDCELARRPWFYRGRPSLTRFADGRAN